MEEQIYMIRIVGHGDQAVRGDVLGLRIKRVGACAVGHIDSDRDSLGNRILADNLQHRILAGQLPAGLGILPLQRCGGMGIFVNENMPTGAVVVIILEIARGIFHGDGAGKTRFQIAGHFADGAIGGGKGDPIVLLAVRSVFIPALDVEFDQVEGRRFRLPIGIAVNDLQGLIPGHGVQEAGGSAVRQRDRLHSLAIQGDRRKGAARIAAQNHDGRTIFVNPDLAGIDDGSGAAAGRAIFNVDGKRVIRRILIHHHPLAGDDDILVRHDKRAVLQLHGRFHRPALELIGLTAVGGIVLAGEEIGIERHRIAGRVLSAIRHFGLEIIGRLAAFPLVGHGVGTVAAGERELGIIAFLHPFLAGPAHDNHGIGQFAAVRRTVRPAARIIEGLDARFSIDRQCTSIAFGGVAGDLAHFIVILIELHSDGI